MRILRKRVGGQAADLLKRSLDNDPLARPTMKEWFLALRSDGDGPARSGSPSGQKAPLAVKPLVEPDIHPGTQIGTWTWTGQGWVRRRS
jgi:hypothetical protein